MKWTQINAFALGAMLTLPATGQTLEQAISITLATNPELKSAFI